MGVIAAFLLNGLPQITDELMDMYTRLVGRWFNKADKRRWETFQNHGRSINQKLHDFIVLGRTLIEARGKKLDLGRAVEAAVGWGSTRGQC